MVQVYYVNVDSFRSSFPLEHLLGHLPESIHDRARRYRREEDAYHFVLGRLLLRAGLQEMGLKDPLNELSISDSGKPLLEGIFFNISHSGGRVVCAFSRQGPLGIDIEQKREVDLPSFRAWFTDREWADIHSAQKPLRRFYHYWTRKESIIKALGITLARLHEIEIDPALDHFIVDERKWYLKDLNVGTSYTGAICSKVPVEKIEMKKLVMEDVN